MVFDDVWIALCDGNAISGTTFVMLDTPEMSIGKNSKLNCNRPDTLDSYVETSPRDSKETLEVISKSKLNEPMPPWIEIKAKEEQYATPGYNSALGAEVFYYDWFTVATATKEATILKPNVFNLTPLKRSSSKVISGPIRVLKIKAIE